MGTPCSSTHLKRSDLRNVYECHLLSDTGEFDRLQASGEPMNHTKPDKRDALAIAMIALFLFVITLWTHSRFFSAGAAAIVVVIFIILFIFLFWGGGVLGCDSQVVSLSFRIGFGLLLLLWVCSSISG